MMTMAMGTSQRNTIVSVCKNNQKFCFSQINGEKKHNWPAHRCEWGPSARPFIDHVFYTNNSAHPDFSVADLHRPA